MPTDSPSACLIVIGNEILSGRTQDKNISWLAKELNEIGVRLSEARVIPDDTQIIVDTVNACRASFNYVLATGGIGPTHDDITADAIAKAFGVKLERNKEAQALMERHYGRENLNAARLKMTDIPRGARLISNPVSIAPGFVIKNVYVFAGVPEIMQAMFDSIKHEFKGGAVMLSKTLSAFVTEGVIAEKLSALQDKYPDVAIGSYPFIRKQRLGTSLVARSEDARMLDDCASDIFTLLKEYTSEIVEE